MRRRNIDLIIVIILTLLAVTVSLVGATKTILGFSTGIPLFLILPGYALSEALIAPSAFGLPERIVLGLGMSLGIAVLGGLALNLTPWGLQPFSWAILLGGVTLVATAVAFRSRSLVGPRYPDPEDDTIAKRRSRRPARLDPRSTVLFGLAVLTVIAALSVAYVGAVKQPFQGFTQLWMLPGESAGPNVLLLGISNHEPMETTYQLELRLDDQVIRRWPSIDLRAGAQWETTITLSQGEYGTGQLEAVLYRSSVPDVPYRRVHLTP